MSIIALSTPSSCDLLLLLPEDFSKYKDVLFKCESFSENSYLNNSLLQDPSKNTDEVLKLVMRKSAVV